MAHRWCFLISLVLLQGYGVLSAHKRVVDGVNARIEDFPYQVSIMAGGNNHHCGGVIISSKHVLTAAHCLDGFDPEDFYVVAGTSDNKKPGFKTYGSDIYVHETYNKNDAWKDDLAILTVDKPFPLSKTIAIAQLPSENSELPERTSVTVTGFGRTSLNSFPSNILKKVDIQTKDLSFCNEKYKKVRLNFKNTQICAYNNKHKGICRGDSGGPLSAGNKVVGITSFTNEGCADSGYPAVFVKLSKYVSWIRKHAK